MSDFRRKHYYVIAAILRLCHYHVGLDGRIKMSIVVDAFADFFAKDNLKFDVELWKKHVYRRLD